MSLGVMWITCVVLNLFQQTCIILYIFYHSTSLRWYRHLKFVLKRASTRRFYAVNTMAFVLEIQGARASAFRVLNLISQNIKVSAPEVLTRVIILGHFSACTQPRRLSLAGRKPRISPAFVWGMYLYKPIVTFYHFEKKIIDIHPQLTNVLEKCCIRISFAPDFRW